jgi:hypothetical protein
MLGSICLHLPHACIIIVENICKLDREAGGGFSCQSKTIGDIQEIMRKYFCILPYYTAFSVELLARRRIKIVNEIK